MKDYRKEVSFEDRKHDSQTVLDIHPDMVPVIVNSKSCYLVKQKYLVPDNSSMMSFFNILKKRIQIDSQAGVYIYVEHINGKESDFLLPSLSESIISLYSTYVYDDGFMYVSIEKESTFG
jgi:hypothetical protein